ncbi:MAG: PQQ-binding-like beta-propeller repeat protein [Candidatus Hodarchaeota archaeon]
MKVKELWRVKYNDPILGIEFGDINNNSHKEVIAYTKTGKILIISLKGKLLREEQITENSSIWQAHICDINNDGKKEIILIGIDGVLRIFGCDLTYNLSLRWSHQFGASISGVLIDDINNDGLDNVIAFSLDKTIRVLNPLDGSLVWGQVFKDGIEAAIIWSEIIGVKNKELIACGNDGTVRAFNGKSGELSWFKQFSDKIRCITNLKSNLGNLVICGGDDKLLHFIDINLHEEIKSMEFNDYVWNCKSFPSGVYNKLLVSTYSFAYLNNSNPDKKNFFTSKLVYFDESLKQKWELKNKNIETIHIVKRNKRNLIFLGTTIGELIIVDEITGKILLNIKYKSCLNDIKYCLNLNYVIICHDNGTIFAYFLEES